MLERLRKSVPEDVLGICRRLHEAGFGAWLVGGAVRDRLLSSDPHHAPEADWDIATSATPEQVQKLFRRVVPTGIQHGTVTVLAGKVGYEVTTLRGETTYSDGRRPDSVHFVDDIVADLARRDFTINAMAYDSLAERLIDPFNGLADLKARRLRAVGDASERFAEDGLRVLRAARFVASLEMELEEATARAIEPSLSSYRKVSAERVRDEWLKTMKAERPSRGFEVMRQHGLLAITAPELLESVGCEQNRYHAFDVWGHAMHCMDSCPPDPALRVAGLLHDVGKPRSRAFSTTTDDYTFYEHDRIGAEMAEPMLERLRFSNEDRARIVSLVRHHLICYEPGWSDAAVRRWLKRVSPELARDLYELNAADVLAKGKDASADLANLEALKRHVQKVEAEGAALSVKELAIDGSVLMRELGLEPGPVIGVILRELLEEVIEDPGRNEQGKLLVEARGILRRERGEG